MESNTVSREGLTTVRRFPPRTYLGERLNTQITLVLPVDLFALVEDAAWRKRVNTPTLIRQALVSALDDVEFLTTPQTRTSPQRRGPSYHFGVVLERSLRDRANVALRQYRAGETVIAFMEKVLRRALDKDCDLSPSPALAPRERGEDGRPSERPAENSAAA
jgi:hypothetical protein